MRKILVTGGTAFVSRYAAEFFAALGNDVYVLNRNTKPQPKNTTLIKADRRALGDLLKAYSFDAVLDICAYTEEDVTSLVSALGEFGDYILISSSAVYPHTLPMPLKEEYPVGKNKVWGDYGINKIGAETALQKQVPNAYILRPPYLYGPMQNLYREGFVFDCAMNNRTFVLPPRNDLSLQFLHVQDLCRFMNILLTAHPKDRIFNVGNPDTITVTKWADMCYNTAGKKIKTVAASHDHPVRNYFCFYDYNYSLDVSKQQHLMPDTISLEQGLKDSFEWYKENSDAVIKKPYCEYIDKYIL